VDRAVREVVEKPMQMLFSVQSPKIKAGTASNTQNARAFVPSRVIF
jgi:hypothetical protein